jgi:hypothetical protein
MKRGIKIIGLLVGMILMINMTMEAQGLTISGEIRPRAEYRHGFQTLSDSAQKPAFYIDQRTRLNVGFNYKVVEVKLTVQDVRTWGSQKQLVGNEDFGVSIHEAWGLAKLTDNFKLKFGRQELVYDDSRILGNVGWAQQARSHDALLFLYEKDKLKIHVGGAFNQNSPQMNTTSYTVGGSYKTMEYLWANYKFNKEFKVSLLAMGVGQQVNFVNVTGDPRYQDNYTLTTGTRLVYKKEKLGVNFNGYYQLGSTSTWPAMDVSAYNMNLEVSYQVAKPVRLLVGFEMLSGNSQVDTTASYNSTQHAFTPFFGTNHKFNGFMDYFYVGNHVGNVGLNDLYLRLDYKHDKFNAGITGHAFMANNDILDVPELISTGNRQAMSPYLGAEIDLFGGFDLTTGVKCKLGYSHLIGTTSMEAIKGGDMNEISNWGYLMIILKPTLFEQKKKDPENSND